MTGKRSPNRFGLSLALLGLPVVALMVGVAVRHSPSHVIAAPMPQAVQPAPTPTPAPQTPAAYLSDVLDWIQAASVRTAQADWVALRADVAALVPNPRTTADTYPAIRLVLRRLGDNHSFFMDPETAARSTQGSALGLGLVVLSPELVVARVAEGSPADLAGIRAGDVVEMVNGEPPMVVSDRPGYLPLGGPSVRLTLRRAGQSEPFAVSLEPGSFNATGTPRARLVAEGIGYIELPQAVGATANSYATIAQQAIREVDAAGTCGWVVDLRRNTGGNMYPMVAGVGPLLGDGELGAFVDARGRRTTWAYRDGSSYIGSTPLATAEPTAYILQRPNPPVAVLTSRMTASSGEFTLLSFLGRADVRTLGEPTAGVPTANTSRRLSDGAMIALTVALGSDRLGRLYDTAITPDEPLTIDWTRIEQDGEPALQTAIAWLRAHPACQ